MILPYCQEYAANKLVEVVSKVYGKALEGAHSDLLRTCLRAWRLWYMDRVSISLYNRKRLRNWLRICARLRYLYRGMPLYRNLRSKWAVITALLSAVDSRLRYGTPDLLQTLRRRRELLLGFSHLLERRGLVPGRYCPAVLLPATLDRRAILQRWVQYTQLQVASRMLCSSLRVRGRFRGSRVAFDGWRWGLPPSAAAAYRVRAPEGAEREKLADVGRADKDLEGEEGSDISAMKYGNGRLNDLERRGFGDFRDGFRHRGWDCKWVVRGKKPLPELRAEADLEVMRRTVVAAWRGSLVRTIVSRQRRHMTRLKRSARMEPTFKKFLQYHKWQASERVRTESRLLVDAFVNRGRLKFNDLDPALALMPPPVSRGTSPHDLIPFRDPAVPGAYLASEVRIMTRIGEGVVGIQLVVCGGSGSGGLGGKEGTGKTQELDTHGSSSGEGRTTQVHSFPLHPPIERLSRLECQHGDTVERLRVCTSTGRWSPWFGETLSEYSKITSLPDWSKRGSAAVAAAAAATMAGGEGESDSEENDEIGSAKMGTPAYGRGKDGPEVEWDPQTEYITGLAGTQTSERLVSLGVVTRHVTSSHIFSFLWTAPAEEDGMDENSKWGEAGSTWEDPAESPRSQGSRSTRQMSSFSRMESNDTVSLAGQISVASSGGSTRGIPDPMTGSVEPKKSSSGGGTGMDEGETWRIGSGPSADDRPLSRAEAKRRRFAEKLAAKERKKEEAARLAREAAEEQRLIQQGDVGELSPHRSYRHGRYSHPMGARGMDDTPSELWTAQEFAHILRMRRTDARRALERSVAIACAVWGHGGDPARARRVARVTSTWALGETKEEVWARKPMENLTCVMGLANWLHEALLPHLVPLPTPAAGTSELFRRGEMELLAARQTALRAAKLRQNVRLLENERKGRPRRGMLSPTDRAREVQEREDLRAWAAEASALQSRARIQRAGGESLLDEAREQMPKISQRPAGVKYYVDMLALARTQLRLEREFGHSCFRQQVPAQSTSGG
ncbi:unnamed protein product, partial [Discosporangium mesarthrocarpum]